MERENTELTQRYFFFLDILLTMAAFGTAYLSMYDISTFANSTNDQFLLILILFFGSISYFAFNLYGTNRYLDPLRALGNIVNAVFWMSVCAMACIYLLRHQGDLDFLLIGLFASNNVLLLFAVRMLRLFLFNLGKRNGCYQKEVLIIGSRERAWDLIHYMKSMKHSGYNVIGCLEVEGDRIEKKVDSEIKVVGLMKDFRSFLLTTAVDEIVFAMPLKMIENVLEYISFAEKLGINIRILPDWQIHTLRYHPEFASSYIEEFVGTPTLAISSTPRRWGELIIKEFIDRSSALLGLIVLAPLFAVIAMAIKLSSSGPVLFRQQRCSLNGRIFNLYKFRSMVVNAEELRKELEDQNEQDGPVFKLTKDPRVTWIGSLLRKTSLDELPQLINVVKGEMSLVGPRPPLPAEVKQYDPWQRRRLSMKPGITCIWQVSGRNNIDFESWMRMDLEYIDSWNLLLDFKLLLKTVPAVLFGTGR